MKRAEIFVMLMCAGVVHAMENNDNAPAPFDSSYQNYQNSHLLMTVSQSDGQSNSSPFNSPGAPPYWLESQQPRADGIMPQPIIPQVVLLPVQHHYVVMDLPNDLIRRLREELTPVRREHILGVVVISAMSFMAGLQIGSDSGCNK